MINWNAMDTHQKVKYIIKKDLAKKLSSISNKDKAEFLNMFTSDQSITNKHIINITEKKDNETK
jgi:hypothetical protein